MTCMSEWLRMFVSCTALTRALSEDSLVEPIRQSALIALRQSAPRKTNPSVAKSRRIAKCASALCLGAPESPSGSCRVISITTEQRMMDSVKPCKLQERMQNDLMTDFSTVGGLSFAESQAQEKPISQRLSLTTSSSKEEPSYLALLCELYGASKRRTEKIPR